MQNKIIKFLLVNVCMVFGLTFGCRADTVFENVADVIEEVNSDAAANEEFSADAIEDYQVEGSLF